MTPNMYIKFIIVYILIDLIWLIGGKKLHNSQIKLVQKSDLTLRPLGAIMFYLVAPLGYFVFVKQIAKNKQEAFKYGALMGFLMYSTFDFTNLAVFKDYTLKYALMDTLWGTIVYGILCSLMWTR